MRIFALMAIAVLAVVGFVAFDPSYQAMRQEQAAHQAELNRLQEEQLQLQLDERRSVSPAVVATGAGLRLGALLVGGLVVAIALDFYRQRRRPLIMPNSRGLLPVSRDQLVMSDDLAGELARLMHQNEGLRAVYQVPTPAHLNYAPRIDTRAADVPAAAEEVHPAAFVAPTFTELLNRGRVGRGNPLVLGYDSIGAELSGSWLDLYSTCVGGMPGTGKTTTQRFLACQTALQGARFAVIDPHAGASDDSLAATLAPLSSAFVCEPASDDRSILETVRYVADVGRRRVEGKDDDITPVILWADELTALLGRSAIADDLAELLERIAQEYRKRHVFVCGSGQIWTASRSTTELRDSFASVICHRMKRNQARLLVPSSEALQVERLATGQALLWRTSGETVVLSVPNTTVADVGRVAGLLAGGRKPAGSPPETSASAAESRRPVSGQDARILALFVAGADVSAIVREIYGVSNGRKYVEGLGEVNSVLRRVVGGAK